jgi:hypothetical protein
VLTVTFPDFVGVPYHLSNEKTVVIKVVHGGLTVFFAQRGMALDERHELRQPNADRSVSHARTWFVIGFEPIRIVGYDVERRSRSYTIHFHVSSIYNVREWTI